MSEVPSSAGWELCKCGRGSTGQCTLYTLCNTRLTMERGEMTVGNDFCTFLFAELHGALNFHTIHSFLKEKEVWFETWYTCWIVLQNECTRPDFFFHDFSRSFPVGGRHLPSTYTSICWLNKYFPGQPLGLGGCWHFHLQNAFEKRLCMKVAGWERLVFFDLFKKYFLLNYCYNYVSHLVHWASVFRWFLLFFYYCV